MQSSCWPNVPRERAFPAVRAKPGMTGRCAAREIRTAFPLVNSSESGLFGAAFAGGSAKAERARATVTAGKTAKMANSGKAKTGKSRKPVATAAAKAGAQKVRPKPRRSPRSKPFRRWHPRPFPVCRPWPACGSPRARPASATRAAPTFCWPCWLPGPRSPASSPSRKRLRRRSNGAAKMQAGSARALVVNSGNANAFTGRPDSPPPVRSPTWPPPWSIASRRGLPGVHRRHRRAAAGRAHHEGPGPACRSRRRRRLARGRPCDHDDGHLPKGGHRTAEIDGHRVTINGIAKGSGMIAPDMATMLAFVFTDASIPAPVLQDLLSSGVRRRSMRSRSTAILPPATRCCFSPRARAHSIRRSARRPTSASRISTTNWTRSCSTLRYRSCATARGRRN